jgi:cytochrome c-type biogenesis protein
MDFGFGTYGFGLLAGVLSTLSPCVLPILPILLGSALAAHPKAPLALAAGLALSYAVIGSTLAWAGSSLGIDASAFRVLGAAILGALGLVLMSSTLQRGFASATAGIGDAGNAFVSKFSLDGLKGQFLVGLALGVVWSPCVGPTLGAAIVLASQGSHLPQVGLLMAVFGIGAALPVVAISHVSRTVMTKARGRLIEVGKMGKSLMGAIMLAIAVLILTGADRPLEGWIVQVSPDWLTTLTTRF